MMNRLPLEESQIRRVMPGQLPLFTDRAVSIYGDNADDRHLFVGLISFEKIRPDLDRDRGGYLAVRFVADKIQMLVTHGQQPFEAA